MNNFQTIVLQFCLTSGQKFFIQSNSNETLSQIFNRLKQVNNLQIQVGCLIANANKIDLDKTISELNIQNNQLILIIPKFNEPDNEIKSEYKLNKDEMMLIRKWKAEFKEKQLLEEAMKKLNKEKRFFIIQIIIYLLKKILKIIFKIKMKSALFKLMNINMAQFIPYSIFFIDLYLQNLCYYLIVKPFYYYFNKKILKYLDTFLFLLNIDIRLDL